MVKLLAEVLLPLDHNLFDLLGSQEWTNGTLRIAGMLFVWL